MAWFAGRFLRTTYKIAKLCLSQNQIPSEAWLARIDLVAPNQPLNIFKFWVAIGLYASKEWLHAYFSFQASDIVQLYTHAPVSRTTHSTLGFK